MFFPSFVEWPQHTRADIARQFHTGPLRRELDELATVIARGMCSAAHWHTN